MRRGGFPESQSFRVRARNFLPLGGTHKLAALVLSTVALPSVATSQIGTLTIPDDLSVYVQRGNAKFFGGTIKKGSKKDLRRVSFDGFKNGGGLTERVGFDTAVQALNTEIGVFARFNSMDAVLQHRYTMNKTATSDALLYSTTSTSASNVKPGAHHALYVLPFLKGTKVAIQFGVSNLTKFVTTKVATVDIGDDNVIDWDAPKTAGSYHKTILATADARGIVIRLSLHTQGRFPKGAYNFWRGITTSIGFNWKPGQRRCDLTSRGTACGPKLTGALSTNWQVLDLTVSGAEKGRFGLFLIGGGTPFSIRFPGTSCFLYTRLHVLLPHVYDGTGQAKFRFPVPNTYLGMVHFQDLALDLQSATLGVESTNSMMLHCVVR